MKIIKCRLCGGQNFKKLFTIDIFTIQKCSDCGLIQTKNFVTPNYVEYHRDESYEKSQKFLKYFFEKRYEIILPYAKRPGTVLEIGSSTGVLLDIYKKHKWNTFGVEPSQSAEIADRNGHTIYNTTLEQARIPNKNFDLIIANHVLEHIENPKVFLEKINSLLKDNGILYVDVPNAASLYAYLTKQNWPYYLPREHVLHFTPKTIQLMLEKCGYKIVYIHTKSGIFEVSKPLEYILYELVMLKKNFFRDLLFIPLDLVEHIMNRGNSISVIATKS